MQGGISVEPGLRHLAHFPAKTSVANAFWPDQIMSRSMSATTIPAAKNKACLWRFILSVLET
jgi:hypothetical protein